MTEFQSGQLDALCCISEWLQYSYNDGNTPSYRAALDDMIIHVGAAIERAKNGEKLNTVSEVDLEQHARPASLSNGQVPSE